MKFVTLIGIISSITVTIVIGYAVLKIARQIRKNQGLPKKQKETQEEKNKISQGKTGEEPTINIELEEVRVGQE